MKKLLLVAAALGAASQASATPVVLTLTGAYNTVTMGGSSWTGDFQTECCSTELGLVTGTLGLNNLPVYSGNGGPFPLKDVNPATNEIQWWTSGTHNGDVVTPSGSGPITTPFSNTAMFPPTGPNGNVGNDSNGFLTAEFTGTFSLAQKSNVQFTLGADDDAFFYVDGNLVDSLGGVHPDEPAGTPTVTLSAGLHDIELFYADRNQVAAALNFGLDSSGITPVPEPSTWAMMLLGFAGLGFLGFRQGRKTSAAIA